MSSVEEFIYTFENSQREIMLYFHKLFVDDLNLTGKIRYKIPFYYRMSWICYLNPTRDGKIELAFTRGNELSNIYGILYSKGRKQVYGIDLEKMSDIQFELINETIQEAIMLDETIPYQSKRKE